MDNIFDKHINKTQKKLKKYTSMILKSKYDATITNELIQTYIDARYYNYKVDDHIRVFHRRIFEALKNKAEELMIKKTEDKEVIENTLTLFQYYFYFDYVRKSGDIEKVVSQIEEKRRTKFGLRISENDHFLSEFMELVDEDMNEVIDEIQKYNTKDFDLVVKRVDPKFDCYYTKLKYNFKMPEIFNKEIVELTFNEGLIAEDKLFVSFPLVTIEALKDVLDGNFSKMYLVELSYDIFKKRQKMDNIFECISNQAAQDKISFLCTFDQFNYYRKDIFKLMRKGFGFTLKTDKNMPKLTADDIKILEIFDYILADAEDVNKKKYSKHNTILL